jgi:hypothetical protein
MFKFKTVSGLLVACFLAACASDVMQSYVGKSINEPMLDYGRPTDVLDLGDGRRAFQWAINSSGYMPITSPSYGTIYGSNGWASITTNSTSYVPYSQDCHYTLTAKQSGNDWIVDGFRKPSTMCE